MYVNWGFTFFKKYAKIYTIKNDIYIFIRGGL